MGFASGLVAQPGSGVTFKEAVKQALGKYGAVLRVATVRKAAKRDPGGRPRRPGRQTKFSKTFEEKVVCHIEAMRAQGFPIFQDTLRAMVDDMCEDDAEAKACFPNGTTYKWFRLFLKRWESRLGVSAPPATVIMVDFQVVYGTDLMSIWISSYLFSTTHNNHYYTSSSDLSHHHPRVQFKSPQSMEISRTKWAT